jgi:hypothetical protein
MPTPAEKIELANLKKKAETLEEKIRKLKSKELNAEESKDDGRQEEAIMRNEKFLRDIKNEIARIEGTTQKPR